MAAAPAAIHQWSLQRLGSSLACRVRATEYFLKKEPPGLLISCSIGTRHQMSFSATWITRPGPAPVIRPNVLDDSVVFGLLKFT